MRRRGRLCLICKQRGDAAARARLGLEAPGVGGALERRLHQARVELERQLRGLYTYVMGEERWV